MKYDKMVAIVREESDRKIRIAKKAIADMVNKKEKVTVSALVEKTGLSRGFFYKNPTVRIELDYAKCKQKEINLELAEEELNNDAQEKVLGKEMIKIRLLNEELISANRALEKSNSKLRKEIARLKNQIQHKQISVLKDL